MQIVGKPNNDCRVGWSKWDIKLLRVEFDVFIQQLTDIGIERSTTWYGVDYRRWCAQTIPGHYIIGFSFPSKAENIMTLLTQGIEHADT